MIKLLSLDIGIDVKVSDSGEIFTLDHNSIRKNGRVDNRKGKKLKLGYDQYGYLRCVLSHNGKRRTYIVHRLVAEAFIPNPENKPTVNHINGIKDDNRVANLEWATHSEQKIHSITHNLCTKNVIALKKHNEKNAKPIKYDGVIYNSIRQAQRVLHLGAKKIKERGEMII